MPERTCTMPDCTRKHVARGLCSMHWKREHGKPRRTEQIECATCGTLCDKAPDKRRPNRFCSWVCRDLWNLEHCTMPTPPTPTQRVCPVPADHPARWYGTASAVTYTACPECAHLIATNAFSPKVYCTQQCRAKARNRRKAEALRSKPKRMTRWRKHALAVHTRDDWTCWLCGGRTTRTYTPTDPLSPTLDHLIPRSLGGTHDISNLGTAHMVCNSTRGATELINYVRRDAA